MLRLPPLTELRAFEAAARHLSFKDAAAELGVTPTAISHQIRLLERHCGRPLFRRRPRPLSLTGSGEQLFPVVRDGFERFADALASVRAGSSRSHLRVTATNAFAARWLVPKLPLWRRSHPRLPLDIVGTDDVLDVKAGEVDVAIRYARTPPAGLVSIELARDRFQVVASPSLVGSISRTFTPAELARFPLIACRWPPTDRDAPTWERFEIEARRKQKRRPVPALARQVGLSFHEELHAIEAVIAGQGLGICSEVLVGHELTRGTLIRVSDISLPGYGFYGAYRPGHPKQKLIAGFLRWMRTLI